MSKTVLVTGASSGFGKSIAEKFSAEGFQVIATGRRRNRLDELCKALSKNAPALPLCFDVQSQDAVSEALLSLPVQFQQIDVLINNAGLALGLDPAQSASLEDWEIMIDTNIKGLLYCTRALLPRMLERNCGHIVNIGSIAGNWPYPGGNVYGATKSFVRQFSLNLRCDLLGTKVRVTNIEPGLAETEFSLVRFKGNSERASKTYQGTQSLQPEDIAEAAYWACSQPAHVNINSIELMPACQAWGPFAVTRD